jgi:hypothetical protein
MGGIEVTRFLKLGMSGERVYGRVGVRMLVLLLYGAVQDVAGCLSRVDVRSIPS